MVNDRSDNDIPLPHEIFLFLIVGHFFGELMPIGSTKSSKSTVSHISKRYCSAHLFYIDDSYLPIRTRACLRLLSYEIRAGRS